MYEEKIELFCPLNLVKSEGEGEDKEWVMQGIASTSSSDSDGETLEPSGADLGYFLKYGEINYNHMKKNLDYVVGYPKTAMVNNDGAIEVSFGLFKNKKLSKSIYEHANNLEQAETSAKLGLSIEGIVPKNGRDPKNPKIIKSWRMTGLAVTPIPKNADTTCFIKKGETIEFTDESLDIFEKAVSEELLEKSNQIEELVKLNENQEEPLSSEELVTIINNKDMKLKEILDKVTKGEKVETTPEELEQLKKAIDEGLITEPKKEEVEEVAKSDEVSAEDKIIKAVGELITAGNDAVKSEIDEIKKSNSELTEEISALKSKYEEIDNTPVAKSTTEAVTKSEGEAVTKSEGSEDNIELNIATEDGVNAFYKAVDALAQDGGISSQDARLAKIHVQQGVVSEEIEGLLKAEEVVITGMDI